MEKENGVQTAWSSHPQEPFFDPLALVNRLMGDEVLAKKIFDTFLAETGEQLKRLSKYIESKDHNSINNLLHGMKGTAGNIGAETLYSFLMEMEIKAKEKNLQMLLKLLPALENHLQFLQEQIKNSSALK